MRGRWPTIAEDGKQRLTIANDGGQLPGTGRTAELSEMVPLGAKRSGAKGGNVGEGVEAGTNLRTCFLNRLTTSR